MFGAISKLFRKKSAAAPPPAAAASPNPTAKRPPTVPHAAPPAKGVSRSETPARSGVSKPVSTQARASAPPPGQGDTISIPYASIIRLIPNELWGKLAPAGVAGHHFSIGRATALAQLATGAVKVKFGELRNGAPSGVFLNSPAEDNRLIELPLSEILAQLHPDAYSRRDQVAVHIDQEVPDVFGATGSTGAPVRVLQKREVGNTGNTGTVAHRQKAPAAPVRAKPAAPEPSPAAPATSPAERPANVVPLVPSTAAPAAPAPATPPAAPPPSAIRVPFTPATAPSPSAPPATAAKTSHSPTPPIPKAPIAGARPLPKLPANPAPAPAATSPSGFTPIAPIVPLAGPLAQGSFTLGLDALAENWPDAVRQELARLKIPEAKVALPPVDICEGLKRGRIQYPWRTLRSWIQPTPLYAEPSPHDDLVLELPLRTLTPLFLQFIRDNPVNRQTAAADNITEFFLRAEQTSGASVDVLQSLLQQSPAPAPTPGPVAHAPLAASPPPPAAAAFRPAAPAPTAPAPAGDVVLENGLFCIPISFLAPGWPETVQQDIAQFGIAGARLDIPVDVLDTGLRSGKIEFAWADLCAWLNPPSKAVHVSINGEQRLTLPIQLIGPLFLKLRPTAQRRKAAVMSDIPDLFNAAGVPQAPAAPEPAAAPAPAPAPVPESVPGRAAAAAAPIAAPAPRPAPTNLSELFGEASKKSWTPNEIVQRSTQLPGVAGALIALQDGLLVASSLPANLRIEMIAAFVPQIFGRLNQYSKELNLGDATATSFTIPAGTLQIYNAGLIYFAALSKPGENLPIQDLQLIAAELSRHTK